MTERRLAGLMTLLIALPFGFMTMDDYREGLARLRWLSRRNPLTFDRRLDPRLFWLSTAINGLLVGLFALAGVVMIILP